VKRLHVTDLGDEHRRQHRPDAGHLLDRLIAAVGVQPFGDHRGEAGFVAVEDVDGRCHRSEGLRLIAVFGLGYNEIRRGLIDRRVGHRLSLCHLLPTARQGAHCGGCLLAAHHGFIRTCRRPVVDSALAIIAHSATCGSDIIGRSDPIV